MIPIFLSTDWAIPSVFYLFYRPPAWAVKFCNFEIQLSLYGTNIMTDFLSGKACFLHFLYCLFFPHGPVKNQYRASFTLFHHCLLTYCLATLFYRCKCHFLPLAMLSFRWILRQLFSSKPCVAPLIKNTLSPSTRANSPHTK